MDNVVEFLQELTTVSKRYGIVIGGCGCCGSPFLSAESTSDGKYVVDSGKGDLSWVSETKQ